MSVFMGMLNPGQVHTTTHDAIMATVAHDIERRRAIVALDTHTPGAGDLDGGRIALTNAFLGTGAEWLWMVDADMSWPPEALYRLLDAADPDTRPVVGGLCFGQTPAGQHGWGVHSYALFPTIYSERDGRLKQEFLYPRNTLLQVDGTGAAFLLIHRTAIEKIVAHHESDKVWARVIWNGNRYSEDLSFMLRCKAADIPVFVHTGVQTTHAKTVYLDEFAYTHPPARPNVAIIPVKDNLELTQTLVGQLESQPVDMLLLYDNGSTDGTAEWVDHHPHVQRVDAAGWNLHQMWNDGARHAVRFHRHSNVFFLNNDLEVDGRFVAEMAAGLRDTQHVAMSPNYDGRPRDRRFADLHGICAGRYDGTGGLSGFAFAVKAEWFHDGYLFPEELNWWGGDNHIVWSIERSGRTHGMVLDATVDHVNGGGQTGDWDSPELAPQVQADLRTLRDLLRPPTDDDCSPQESLAQGAPTR